MAKILSPREVYGKTLVSLGKEFKEIVVLDADLSKSTGTHYFAKEFPERFFDMGVAEQNMMGVAAGIASCGKIVFVSSFAIFASGRAWEPVRNLIAYSNLNVKIVATHGGITVGEDGSSHQCIEDIALMRVIPQMTVIVPADPVEVEKALRACVFLPGPVYLRLTRINLPILHDEDYSFQVGKADFLRRGKDLTLIACGSMVQYALEAADKLKEDSIECEVINLHTIKPLDESSIIDSVRKTGAVITCEDHNILGGVGGAVAELISENYPSPIFRIGIKDRFGQSGSPKDLLKDYNLTVEDICRKAREILKKKKIF